jgi:hypothetical protein
VVVDDLDILCSSIAPNKTIAQLRPKRVYPTRRSGHKARNPGDATPAALCYGERMTKLEQIEKAVADLSPNELREFAKWFADLQFNLWDRQIERDIAEGKLDELASRALAEHRAGKTTPL